MWRADILTYRITNLKYRAAHSEDVPSLDALRAMVGRDDYANLRVLLPDGELMPLKPWQVAELRTWAANGTPETFNAFPDSPCYIQADAIYFLKKVVSSRPSVSAAALSSVPNARPTAAPAAAAALSSVPNARPAAQLLRDAYLDTYAPPGWALSFVDGSLWSSLAPLVKVLTFDHRTDMVRKVAEEREPTNIGMGSGQYNVDVLSRNFGYEVSGYRSIFVATGRHILPPSLVIYTRTPLRGDTGMLADVVNATGFGFDSEQQPDYIYFVQSGQISEDKKNELIQKIKDVFLLVFLCAEQIGKTQIVLCLLGGGAFSERFPGGTNVYLRTIFFPALKLAVLEKSTDISMLGMMGNPDGDTMDQMISACPGISTEAFGFVPNICETSKASEMLFMNAWDPHSVVGNGNDHDASLDGFFGRNSAMAYLCSPKVNRQIQFDQLVKV